jgi:hypothetical protein
MAIAASGVLPVDAEDAGRIQPVVATLDC